MEDEKQTPYNTPYSQNHQTNQQPVQSNTPPLPQYAQPAPPQGAINNTMPAPQYAQPAQPSQVEHAKPGNIVLQWLTYALWGWTIFATSILASTVLASFVADSNAGDFTAYAVAAVLVLLPISLVCDIFYTKQEPIEKHGAASVVMVIHAVIFALLGIGAIIAAVFSIVSMITSLSDSKDAQVTLYSSIIVAILYASVLIRTVMPGKFAWLRRAFVLEMVIVVGIVATLGIVGPAAKARTTRTDTLIEQNIYSLQTGIEDYSRENNKLPAGLSDISVKGDAKKLVDGDLVVYKPNTRNPSTESDNYGVNDSASSDAYTYKTYYYQLCVNYKASSSDSYSYGGDGKDSSGYSTYVSTYGHPEGEVCYKLKTQGY